MYRFNYNNYNEAEPQHLVQCIELIVDGTE